MQMSADARSQHLADDVVTKRHEVVVVGGGQAGLAIGYFLAQQGARFHDPRGGRRAGGRVARALGLAQAVHAGALQQPSRPCLSRATRTRYPGRDEVVGLPDDYARRFELPVELGSRVRSVRKADGGYLVELDDRTYEADQVVVATGRSRCRSCRRSPRASTRRWCSSTAPPTGPRTPPARAACSWSAAATPASRSPRSSRTRTRSTCRSGHARCRCRSGYSDATCSGISTPPG